MLRAQSQLFFKIKKLKIKKLKSAKNAIYITKNEAQKFLKNGIFSFLDNYEWGVIGLYK